MSVFSPTGVYSPGVSPATLNTKIDANPGAMYAVDVLGFKAANGDPATTSQNPNGTSGAGNCVKLTVPYACTVNNIVIIVGGVMATPTAGVATIATGASNIVNGSGNVTPADGSSFTLTTASTSGYAAAGCVTLSSNTIPLAYTTWSGTSMTVAANGYPKNTTLPTGSTITGMTNGMILTNSAGAILGLTLDQGGVWTTAGRYTTALTPGGVALAAGSTVYVVVCSIATTPVKPISYSPTNSAFISGGSGPLSAGNGRWGTQPSSGLTQVPAGITPGSIVTTNSNSYWMGLS